MPLLSALRETPWETLRAADPRPPDQHTRTSLALVSDYGIVPNPDSLQVLTSYTSGDYHAAVASPWARAATERVVWTFAGLPFARAEGPRQTPGEGFLLPMREEDLAQLLLFWVLDDCAGLLRDGTFPGGWRPVNPRKVERDSRTGRPVSLQVDGRSVRLSAENYDEAIGLRWTPYATPPGTTPRLATLNSPISIEAKVQKHATQTADTGQVAGIIAIDRGEEAGLTRKKEQEIQEAYRNATRKGGVYLMNYPAKWYPTQPNATEGKYDVFLEKSQQAVLAVLHVPPAMVGHNANYGQALDQSRGFFEFWTSQLTPVEGLLSRAFNGGRRIVWDTRGVYATVAPTVEAIGGAVSLVQGLGAEPAEAAAFFGITGLKFATRAELSPAPGQNAAGSQPKPTSNADNGPRQGPERAIMDLAATGGFTAEELAERWVRSGMGLREALRRADRVASLVSRAGVTLAKLATSEGAAIAFKASGVIDG